MRKIISVAIFAMTILSAAHVIAGELQCPTAAQIKQEWATTTFRHIEKIDNQVNFYVSPHHYGTDKNWYITLSIHEEDVERARLKANALVKSCSFISGGLSGFGFYSCGYSTETGEMFFALANREAE